MSTISVDLAHSMRCELRLHFSLSLEGPLVFYGKLIVASSPLKLPVCVLLSNALSYISLFAHHLSILDRIPGEFNSLDSLCSLRICSKNPAFRRSSPSSDRHFKIREIRRLLWDESCQRSTAV